MLRNSNRDEKNENCPLLAERRQKILAKRWIILLIVCSIVTLDTFSASFFGFINDVSSQYFNVDPQQTDFLSTVNTIARSAFGFVLALGGGMLHLRFLAAATCVTILVGDSLILTGVSSRLNFSIVIIGQALNGFGAALAITLSQLTASTWFPQSERGRAVSVPWIFRRLSPVISNLIATQVVKIADAQSASDLNATASDSDREQIQIDRFRISFQYAYVCLSGIALLSFVTSNVFITNGPSSIAGIQPVQRGQSWNVLAQLRGICDLFKDWQYCLLFMMYVLILSVRPMTEWLVSSIALAGFPDMTDSTVGVMFCVGYSVGSLGSPTGGWVLDKFKRPKLTFAFGTVSVMVALGMLSLAINQHSRSMLFVSFMAATFSRDFCFVCINHSLVETLNSKSNAVQVRGFSIAGSAPWFTLAVYTAIIRSVLTRYGPILTALFPLPFHVIALVLYLSIYSPR